MTTRSNSPKSRRFVVKAGLGAFSGAIAAVAATRAMAQDAAKLAQNIVQYQTTPKDGAMCSACVNFVAPNACKIVDGNINPNGWCVAFAPKGG